MKLAVMTCKACKSGKPCPPKGGMHLHLTHLVSVDPPDCNCGALGKVSKEGKGVVFIKRNGKWVRP